MNTHPHSDHTGGLPALVAEGATIVTQKNNEAFFDKALNTPRTLLNDTLAKNPKKAKVEAVAEKKVYSDGTRTVEMYYITAGASLEWPDGRMHRRRRCSSRAISRCLLRAAGQRSCQSPRAGARKAEAGRLRSLHQRPHVRGSADKAELWRRLGNSRT